VAVSSGLRVAFNIGTPRNVCPQVDQLIEGLAQTPDPNTSDAVDDPSRRFQVRTLKRLSPYLLADPGLGYALFEEWGGSLTHTAGARHDPNSLDVLREHAFRRAAHRMWHTPEGFRLEHVVLEFASPRDAESFEAYTARYTCQFANAAWRADVPLPGGGVSEGLGLQVRHRAAAVVEQISWVRGPRRHVVSIGLPDVPVHHGQISRLVQRAAVLDGGN
jgi:hypothetical protein